MTKKLINFLILLSENCDLNFPPKSTNSPISHEFLKILKFQTNTGVYFTRIHNLWKFQIVTGNSALIIGFFWKLKEK